MKKRIRDGYVYLYKSDQQRYIKRARLVMEKGIGRLLLKEELVHHINGVRNDDRIENLQIVFRGEHNQLHRKGKHHLEETKRKISKALKGHEISEKTREKIRKTLIGRKNPKHSKILRKLYKEGKLRVWNKGLKGKKYLKHFSRIGRFKKNEKEKNQKRKTLSVL